jgi:hypothetical protein
MPMPIGHDAQPEEVAELLAWLATPANSMIVGQVIFVAGGAEATGRGEDVWSERMPEKRFLSKRVNARG